MSLNNKPLALGLAVLVFSAGAALAQADNPTDAKMKDTSDAGASSSGASKGGGAKHMSKQKKKKKHHM